MVLSVGLIKTINGVTFRSRAVPGVTDAVYQEADQADAILRISEDGTITEYHPTTLDEDGYHLAFENAISALVDGDTLDGQGHRYSADSGIWTIQNHTDITIKNFNFARLDGTAIYTRMLELDGCENASVIDCSFDGEAGIAAPTDTPPTHTNTQSNAAGTNTYMLSIKNSNETAVSACSFKDHAGQEVFNAVPLPYYQEAMGINIDENSRGTKVTNSQFERIGYAGIADSGQNTQVSDCTFDNCQWHGYVMRKNEFTLANCIFTRETTTTIGYQGAVDISPTAQINHAVVEGCTFDFPYAVTPHGGGGMFMIKMSDCDKATIKNCTIKHGLCNTAANSVSHSIRFEGEDVGKVTIEGCTLSGGIGHILGAGPTRRVDRLTVRDTRVCKDNDQRYAMLVTCGSIVISDCHLRYDRYGLSSHDGATSYTRFARFEDTIFETNDSEAAYAISDEVITGIEAFSYWETSNRLRTGTSDTQFGETVTFSHALSNTQAAIDALTASATREDFVDVVSDLFSISPSNGDTIDIKRYTTNHAVGDGSGQMVVYSSGSSATIDGITVFPGVGSDYTFAPATGWTGTGAGTGRFIASENETINAKKAGVRGSSAAGQTGRIEAVINHAGTNNKTVYFPADTYLIDAKVTVANGSRGFSVIGDGIEQTIFDASSLTGDDCAIELKDATLFELHGFTVTGGASCGHGLRLQDNDPGAGAKVPQNGLIRSVQVTDCTGTSTDINTLSMPACGIYVDGALEVKFDTCKLTTNDIGAYAHNCETVSFENCTVDACTEAGIVMQGGEKCRIEASDIVGSATTAGTFNLISVRLVDGTKPIDRAGIVSIDGDSNTISRNKTKNADIMIRTESTRTPDNIYDNLIRTDDNATYGVYATNTVNLHNNSFSPIYAATSTRIECFVDLPAAGGWLNSFGSIIGNKFDHGGGGQFDEQLQVKQNSASFQAGGVISGNTFGKSGGTTNATTISKAFRVFGKCDGLVVQGNTVYAGNNVTITDAFHLGNQTNTGEGLIFIGNRTQATGTGAITTTYTEPFDTGPYYIRHEGEIREDGVRRSVGTGSPEGVVTGNVGDHFYRTDGSSGSTLYIKTSGTGNTGWQAETSLFKANTWANAQVPAVHDLVNAVVVNLDQSDYQTTTLSTSGTLSFSRAFTSADVGRVITVNVDQNGNAVSLNAANNPQSLTPDAGFEVHDVIFSVTRNAAGSAIGICTAIIPVEV